VPAIRSAINLMYSTTHLCKHTHLLIVIFLLLLRLLLLLLLFLQPRCQLYRTPPHTTRLTGPILASSFTSISLLLSSSNGLTAVAGSWGASTGLWGSGICSGRASSLRRVGRCEIWSMLPLRTRSRKDGRALRRGCRPSIQLRWWW
jgi:hypothetical protein